jgi:hypothetical protein
MVKETAMLRRLQSMIAWNTRFRSQSDQHATYYNSLAARNSGRGERQQEIDAATYRMIRI